MSLVSENVDEKPPSCKKLRRDRDEADSRLQGIRPSSGSSVGVVVRRSSIDIDSVVVD